MNILVVENHLMMLDFMSKLLEERGHQIKTAKDGLSALEVLRSWVPDIMFVDLVMPNISGDKLCRIVSNDPQLSSIKIVILSGLASEHELDFRALGACACIAKGPFKMMSNHVDLVLDRLASGDVEDISKRTLGVEALQSRQMTQELLSIRQHLEGILENLTEGILELTTDGDVVLANQVAARLIGRPEEQLLGAKVYELFTAADREAVKKLLTPEGAEPSSRRACEVTVNDRVLSLRAVAVLDQRLHPFLVMLDDITERKRAEADYRRELEVNRAVARLSNTLISPYASLQEVAEIILESARMITGSEDGLVSAIDPESGDILVSALTSDMKPYAESFAGRWDSLPADDRLAGLWDCAAKRLEPLVVNSPEINRHAGHGSDDPLPFRNVLSVPATVSGRLVGQITVANAATAYAEPHLDALRQLAHMYGLAVRHNRSQEMLATVNEQLQSSIDSMPIGYILWDPDFRVIEWNHAAERIFGYSKNEVLGTRAADLIVPHKDRENVGRVIRILQSGDAASFSENDNLQKDGALITCQWHNTPLKTSSGSVSGILSMIEDISTSVRQRKERAALEEQLHQAQKMEAIGQLASGVAHDFNNQLAVILGIADMLSDDLEDPQAKENAEMIARAAKRSADLTRQLLTFARKIDHRAEPLDIHASILEVTTLLGRSLDKRIVINSDLKADSHIILGDRTQIENALFNLALNARDAMPEGGELILGTDVVKINQEWLASRPYQLSYGFYLVVSVTDTGVGMDEQTQRRVFEPFFTTKDQGKGTGMGLAAVYGTVKSHGGAIEVSSTLGQGSVFSVFLPLADPQAEETTEAETEARSDQGARILVVDDEDLVRKMLTKMLTKLGHHVVACGDGVDAIDYYMQSWRQVDLVILDLVMPRLGGREAYRRMRQINPDLKALLTTGTSSHKEARQLLSEGVLSILEKPYNMAALRESLARTL
jgi:PAS domain S-box-containing protein